MWVLISDFGGHREVFSEEEHLKNSALLPVT